MESTSSARKEHGVLPDRARSAHVKDDTQRKGVMSPMEQLLQRTHEEILQRDACQLPERNRASVSRYEH